MSGALVLAGPAHAGVMAAIHAASFPPGERWDERALAALAAQPGAACLLDPQGGFALLRMAADEAEVLTLAVIPVLRRKGRGRALLGAAAQLAAARGARALFLEVSAENAAALALYGAAGFNEAGRRRRYYPGGADALVLRLDLDGPAARDHGAAP